MPAPPRLEKAKLIQVTFDQSNKATPKDGGLSVPVQFNPETLTVTFANQTSGGDQRGGAATQFVAKGTTKLSAEFWFDATVSWPEEVVDQVEATDDVRQYTTLINQFMRPSEEDQTPPGVRFLWGTFLFDGVMESMTEKLEYFSADGKPLRASVSLSLGSQDIQFQINPAAAAAPGAAAQTPGTTPQQPARAGESLQQMAAARGNGDGWKAIAEANGIENPRQIPPGTLIDLNPRRSGG